MATKKTESETPFVEINETENPQTSNENTIPPTDTTAPKRRGRPPGSKNGDKGEAPQKSASRQKKDTEDLAHQIVGLHALAAMATGLQELVISETEGSMLANGLNAVAQEYGLSFTGKTGAAIQLFGALGMVYVPRLFMIKQRMESERQKREAEKPLDGYIMDPTYTQTGPENGTTIN